MNLLDQRYLEQLHWARERDLCERDLTHLASNYLKVKGRDELGLQDLQWRRCQRYVLDRMVRQLREKGYIRMIIEKARQIGLSTLLRALAYQQTAFKDHRNALLIANDDITSTIVFGKDKVFHQNMPQPLKQELTYNTKWEIEYGLTKSRSVAAHASNVNVGAGDTIHFAHITEGARFTRVDQVESSLFPAISDAKGDDFSVVVIEGTAVFGGEWFRDRFNEASAGHSDYEALFLPWFWHEPYKDDNFPEGFRLDPEERDLKRRYNLTNAQLYWRRRKIADYYSANPAFFQQDYPCTHEEAWVLPKGSQRVFSDVDIEAIATGQQPGKQCEITSTGLVDMLGGRVSVWEYPKHGDFYDIGIDVSLGDDAQTDYTAINVIHRQSLEQVAECRLKINPASNDLVDLVYWLGKEYNNAQLVVDITGGWGHNLLDKLRVRNYSNFWLHRVRDSAKKSITLKQGYLINRQTKKWLVTNAAVCVKNRQCRIRSPELVGEMRTYLNIAPEEWEARRGTYDDVLTAWMLALVGAVDERIERTATATVERPTYEPWEHQDIEAEFAKLDLPSPLAKPWR